ncbi:MAG: ribosome biogenesis GTPase Der [Pseudomonadota bacterium]
MASRRRRIASAQEEQRANERALARTPQVAIVGRPNVGKSTLFNRLAGKKLALVDKTPGLTRDRREAEIVLGPWTIELIDTAGLEDGESGSITERMRAQSEQAIREADLVLFVVDSRSGVVPVDEMFAEMVRTVGGPVLLVANKCEGREGILGAYEAFRLGLGDPVAISAEHGDGIGELAGEVTGRLDEMLDEGVFGAVVPPPQDPTAEPAPEGVPTHEIGNRPLKVAIVGRPNAGKSTLVNTLLGQDRMITGPEAGLTRDTISVNTAWSIDSVERAIDLYDTAGLRRKARISAKPEQLSVSDALRAIKFAEVVVLLMDAGVALEKQDLAIADLVAREGRALVIAVNKWDVVEDRQARLHALQETLNTQLTQVRGVALVPISATRGTGLGRLKRAVLETEILWNTRLSTAPLNTFLAEATAAHPPPAAAGRRVKLRFMTQPNARPPTFVAFTTRPDAVPESYVRYLINGIRERFDLPGVPIRLSLRKGKNPYARRSNR